MIKTRITTTRFWFSLIIGFIVYYSWGEIRAIFNKDKQPSLLRACRAWAKFMLYVNGVEIDISGVENIDTTKKYIFACNHQSVMDIIILSAIMPVPFVFIVKKTLFKVPMFGAYMKRAGYLSVDRKNPKEDLKNINNFLEKNTASVLIFPEGTRTSDGILATFKSGVAKFAQSTELPTIPVSISGSIDLMCKGNLSYKPGHVRVVYGAPMKWEGDKKTYLATLKEKIQENL